MKPVDLFEALPSMAVFARVVDAGNFSVAARQLGSMPSTVSRQIKRLEQTLGTQLLERSTRRIRLTEAGAQVYRHCREMLDAASGAVDAAGQLAARPQGRVTLSAPTAFAKTVLHPLIPEFLRRYPEVDVQLVFTDRNVDPLVDDIDLVIRLTERPPLGLAGRVLGSVRWVLCASKAYLDARGTPGEPADLLQHDCLYLGETIDDNRWQLRRGDETQTVAVKGRYIANHAGARLEAAQQGFGIAIVPQFAACQALQQGDVVPVLTDWQLDAGAYIGEVWLLYPPKRFLPPKMRVLIDYCVEKLAS